MTPGIRLIENGASPGPKELSAGVSESVSQQREATQEIANSVLSASTGTDTASSSVGSVSDSIRLTSNEALSVLAGGFDVFAHVDVDAFFPALRHFVENDELTAQSIDADSRSARKSEFQ